MNALIDTNVLLDVLARREPFYADSAKVWTLAESGQITGLISVLSLANLFYLLRRMNGHNFAREALRSLRHIFRLVPMDLPVVDQAVDGDMADFEDAIQFFSAVRAGAAVLITRNPADFPVADIVIQTPTEFLATHFP
jgi:predicted nucleic acid-binding protein